MNSIEIKSQRKYTVSKDLYMQFMEPLGKTDGSVEAAWNFESDDWRADVIAETQKLAPSLIRFGGIYSAYYKWKEGIGDRKKREPMYNVEWCGLETNVVGTPEFVDFCRRVGAKPFINVNFESEGREKWANPTFGKKGRNGSAGEAAEWVSFCNDPDDKLRKSLGYNQFNVKLWQIGNETTYLKENFNAEQTAKHTLEFAKKMKAADPSISLIGWGDKGGVFKKVYEAAGEYIDFYDYHSLFAYNLNRENCPILGTDYKNDAAVTWDFFMKSQTFNQEKIKKIREEISGTDAKIAICESHYSLQSNFRGEALTTFAAAAGMARICNLYEHNGDIIKIANNSDFCGNNWLVNSIMIPMSYKKKSAYLMPVAIVSMLFSNNMGDYRVDTVSDSSLDIAASVTENGEYFLHIVNTSFDKPFKGEIKLDGKKIKKGTLICLGDDEIKSYFGLRDISFDGMKFILNGRSVFQRLVLDQGYYPDGIYTAPNEEALLKDIEISLAAGFNGARLHQKVFEPRFLYYADKMGYLVWGEYGDWGLDYSNAMSFLNLMPEWLEILRRDFNHPSIVGWCPMNESWDYNGHKRGIPAFFKCIYEVTKAYDSTRPVIDTSGGYHVITDVYDHHDYEQNPERLKEKYDSIATNGTFELPPRFKVREKYEGQPFFISEYGGIGWSRSGKGWGYRDVNNAEDFHKGYEGLTKALLDNPSMFGFCYTQLYDVEQEENGLYFYDRTPNADIDFIRKVTSSKAAIEEE